MLIQILERGYKNTEGTERNGLFYESTNYPQPLEAIKFVSGFYMTTYGMFKNTDNVSVLELEDEE